MVENNYPTVAEFQEGMRARSRYLLVLTLAMVCAVIGAGVTVLIVSPTAPVYLPWLVAVIAFCVIAIPVLIWNHPRVGMYILLATALLCTRDPGEVDPFFPLSYLPFWLSASITGRTYGSRILEGMIFSPGEIIMAITAISWLVRTIVARDVRVRCGIFFGWLFAYVVACTIAWVYGVGTGGDTKIALTEVRSQFNMLLAYVLAVNLFVEPKHAKPLLWTFLLAAACLGLSGTLHFVFLGAKTDMSAIMSHADSLSLNIVLVMLVLTVTSAYDRRLTWASVILVPFAITAILANQRRASIAAFVVALIGIMPTLWTVVQSRKKQIKHILIGLVIFSAIYMPVAWNASGPWALPARALRSRNDPNARDAGSDIYRGQEEYDLKVTRNVRPWLGYGYGKPFIQPIPLPHLTTDLLFYMPHNGVMWIWFRTGNIGFFFFMMLIAVVIVRGIHIVRRTKHRHAALLGILAIAQTLMVFTFGKYDILFVYPGQMYILGVLLGVLAAIDIQNNRDDNNTGVAITEPPQSA